MDLELSNPDCHYSDSLGTFHLSVVNYAQTIYNSESLGAFRLSVVNYDG